MFYSLNFTNGMAIAQSGWDTIRTNPKIIFTPLSSRELGEDFGLIDFENIYHIHHIQYNVSQRLCTSAGVIGPLHSSAGTGEALFQPQSHNPNPSSLLLLSRPLSLASPSHPVPVSQLQIHQLHSRFTPVSRIWYRHIPERTSQGRTAPQAFKDTLYCLCLSSAFSSCSQPTPTSPPPPQLPP